MSVIRNSAHCALQKEQREKMFHTYKVDHSQAQIDGLLPSRETGASWVRGLLAHCNSPDCSEGYHHKNVS